MARPRLIDADQTCTVRLSAADLNAFDRAARERGLNRSEVLRWCLRRGRRQLAELPFRRVTPYGVPVPAAEGGSL